jgi:hypothetical protein
MKQFETERILAALIELSVESWRFQKLFGKALAKLDVADANRFLNQHRFFLRKIDDSLGGAGIRLVNIEGQPYEVGAAVTALNIGDFAADDRLVVDQMIEPVVMGESGLLRMGTVMLRKLEP